MPRQTTRRELIKGGVALAGLGVLGLPDWAFPALAQEEILVPFTDLPDPLVLERTPQTRIIDLRTIRDAFTPADQFFTTQHLGHPEIDLATYRLRVSGLVDRPLSLSIDELRAMPSRELVFGFECSGNRGPANGLASNGRWRGVPLRAVLERAGVQPAEGTEVVRDPSPPPGVHPFRQRRAMEGDQSDGEALHVPHGLSGRAGSVDRDVSRHRGRPAEHRTHEMHRRPGEAVRQAEHDLPVEPGRHGAHVPEAQAGRPGDGACFRIEGIVDLGHLRMAQAHGAVQRLRGSEDFVHP